MAYAEVTVIVDGAVEQEETFHDYLLMNAFIDGVREDAAGDGYPTEVYVMEHEHDETGQECSCAQYVADHHPRHAWNMDGPGT
jgi:hypothetical protein